MQQERESDADMIVKFRLVTPSQAEATTFRLKMTGQGAKTEVSEGVYLDIHRQVTVPDSTDLKIEHNRTVLSTELTEADIADDEVATEKEDWPAVFIVECDKLPQGFKMPEERP
jgi:hypothetical protein